MLIAITTLRLIVIQQHVQLLYQFASCDDCCQNTDHRYIMQLTREIWNFNYPSFKAGLSLFGNLEDKLKTAGTKKVKKCEYSNSEIVFEYSNGMQIFEYPNIR